MADLPSDIQAGTPSPAPAPAPAPARTVVSGREDFSATLDSFQGPLDLLLYLIKENEVEITAIPIASILQQYLRFVDEAVQCDLQLAGEFLVMAATLMEIKSRELLPAPEHPGEDDEIIEDPRSELVRQLLEYRKLKDQARALEQSREEWQRCRPRGLRDELPPPSEAESGEMQIAAAREALLDVDLYNLFAAYELVLKSVLAQTPGNIIYDGESLEEAVARIEALLRARPFARFAELLTDLTNRAEIATTFVALLELVRRRAVRLIQQRDFGAIDVRLQQEGEGEALAREESAAAESAQVQALQELAQRAAALEVAGGADGLPWKKKRMPARPKFEGLLRPDDVEELDAEEHEIGRRIDAILAAADAISERFELSREGRERDEAPAAAPTPPVSPSPPLPISPPGSEAG